MKKLLCLVPLALLTACESSTNMSGTLSLRSPVVVTTPGGNAYTLPAGQHRARLQIEKGGGSLYVGSLQIALPRLPAGAEGGRIRLSAAEIGQRFGVDGSITESARRFDREVNQSCIWDTRTEYECHGRGEYEKCESVQKEIMGSQIVRQVGTSRVRDVSLQLTAGRGSPGSFRASFQYADQIDDSTIVSGCQRGWP